MLIIVLVLIGSGAFCLFVSIGNELEGNFGVLFPISIMLIIAGLITGLCTLCGITFVDPNNAVFMTFCTKYKGTIKKNGVFWTNPFYKKHTMSLKVRNFETSKSKVNDANGTPVMIETVIVWKIRDTAKAVFEVANYFTFL